MRTQKRTIRPAACALTLAIASALVCGTPLRAQERGSELLERLIAAYENFEFSTTRELSLRLLQPEVEATPAQRAQATFFAAATSLLATPPDRAEARRLLTRGIRLDVFSAPDTSRFSPDVLLEYERTRRALFAIGVRPLPRDTSLTLDSAALSVVVGTTRPATVRVSLESAARTSYQLAAAVRIFGEGGVRLQFSQGQQFIATGAYTLRIQASDDSGGAITQLTLPVNVAADSLALLPIPPPLADSAFLPDRRPAGPGVRALAVGLAIGGLTASLPTLVTPSSLQSLSGTDARAFAVGAAVALTGVLTLIAQHPGRAIPEAVAYNDQLRAAWDAEQQRVTAENARRRASVRIGLQFGVPTQ